MHILSTWAGNATGPFARFSDNPLANISDPSDEFGANGRGGLRAMARWLGLGAKARVRVCVSTDQKSRTSAPSFRMNLSVGDAPRLQCYVNVNNVTNTSGRRSSWETHMNHSGPLLSKPGKPACRFPGDGTKLSL